MRKTLIIIAMFIVLQLASGVVAMALLSAVTGVTVTAGLTATPVYAWVMGVTLLLTNVLMCVFIYFLLKRPGGRVFADYLHLPGAAAVACGLVAMAALMMLTNGLTELFNFRDLLDDEMSALVGNPLCLVAVCIVGPVAEEVVFRRGVMGSLLDSGTFRRYALVISAAVFALIHFNPAQIPGAFIAGLFLGWLYLRTHGLVLPVLCHVLNNVSSVVFYKVAGTDADVRLADLFPSHALFWLFMVLMAAIFAAAAYGVKRTARRQTLLIEENGPQPASDNRRKLSDTE
jgi:membrane protease YdiL (CAAX protease family)